MMSDLVHGPDGRPRCGWCGDSPIYRDYHDREWGRLADDDRTQFAFIVLESAQAGLSWITILKQREAYRRAYRDFDPEIVARFTDADVGRLAADPGIVRNRRKIEASIGNARVFVDIVERHGSFARWLREFFDGVPVVNHWTKLEHIPAITPRSERIAKELKSRGFRFFGPTITYAHLQATGFVDDHLEGCWRRLEA